VIAFENKPLDDHPPLVLASSSRYRAELLSRLRIGFVSASPEVDETPRPAERCAATADRLAEAKARALAGRFAGALILGSDQVAELDGRTLDKPGTPGLAREQLAASSGRVVHFHTALCLFDTRSGQGQVHMDHTRVQFRVLDAAEIARYVEREQPLDCAGSFKCEGLGISLFERIDNEDPSALIGLPLIALARLLRAAGVALP